MEIIPGLFMGAIGFVFVFVAKSVARRQGMGSGISTALWGTFALTFGTLYFAEGIKHPLLSRDIRFIIFVVFGLVCLLSLLSFRGANSKSNNIQKH